MRFGKNWLLVSCIIIVVGLLVCTAAFFMGGIRFKTESFMEKSLIFDAADVSDIRVSDTSNNVRFTLSDDAFIHVTYSESDNSKYNVSLEGGKLSVSCRRTNWFVSLFSFSRNNGVTVALPHSAAAAIVCNVSSGDISFSDVTALTVKAETASGDISVKNCDFESFLGTVASGDIDISSLDCTAAVTLDTASGDIETDYLSCAALHAETASGDIEADNITCSDMFFDTASGDVDILVCGSEKEYRIAAKSASGDISSPISFTGEKSLKAETASGDISVRFTEG